MRRGFVRPPPKALPSISPRLTMPIWAPGMPGISKVGMPPPVSWTWTSISFSSSLPSRSSLRNFCRVSWEELAPTSASSTRSSAATSAREVTSLRIRTRVIARELLDVAADIADLGEFGRLDLYEGRLGELREAARDLRFADAGRADHEDVLGQHLLAERLGQLLAAPAVAERDRDGALSVAL